jgi:hypothetical protein
LVHAFRSPDAWIVLLPTLVPPTRSSVALGFLILRIGQVVFYILATIHLAILCLYSSVFSVGIVCLDYLSPYIPDFILSHHTVLSVFRTHPTLFKV